MVPDARRHRGSRRRHPGPPADLGRVGPPGDLHRPLGDCKKCKNAGVRTRSMASAPTVARRVHRAAGLQPHVQNPGRSVEARDDGLPAARTAQGIFTTSPTCSRARARSRPRHWPRHGKSFATRSPRRYSSFAPAIRADGDGVLRATADAETWYRYWVQTATTGTWTSD